MTKMKFASARNLPANKQNWSVNFIMNIFQIVTAVTKISKSLKFRPSIISDNKTQNAKELKFVSFAKLIDLFPTLRLTKTRISEFERTMSFKSASEKQTVQFLWGLFVDPILYCLLSCLQNNFPENSNLKFPRILTLENVLKSLQRILMIVLLTDHIG